MDTLVVLNYCTSSVLFVRLSDEQVDTLINKFNNETEAWISETGLEDDYGFTLSECNWMLCDGFPEVFDCSEKDGKPVTNKVIPPALTKPIVR